MCVWGGGNGPNTSFPGRNRGGIYNSASKLEKQQVSTGGIFIFLPAKLRRNGLKTEELVKVIQRGETGYLRKKRGEILLIYHIKNFYERNSKSCDHTVCNIKCNITGPDSLVVRASASGSEDHGFAPRPRLTKGVKNGTGTSLADARNKKVVLGRYKNTGRYLLLVMSQ